MSHKKKALQLLKYLDGKNANLNIAKLQVLLIASLHKDCTVKLMTELTGNSQSTI